MHVDGMIVEISLGNSDETDSNQTQSECSLSHSDPTTTNSLNCEAQLAVEGHSHDSPERTVDTEAEIAASGSTR